VAVVAVRSRATWLLRLAARVAVALAGLVPTLATKLAWRGRTVRVAVAVAAVGVETTVLAAQAAMVCA
jgi:hypothetical protein